MKRGYGYFLLTITMATWWNCSLPCYVPNVTPTLPTRTATVPTRTARPTYTRTPHCPHLRRRRPRHQPPLIRLGQALPTPKTPTKTLTPTKTKTPTKTLTPTNTFTSRMLTKTPTPSRTYTSTHVPATPIPTVELDPTTSIWRFYYYAGSARIAMRIKNDKTDLVFFYSPTTWAART